MKTFEVSVSLISDCETPLEAVHELISFLEAFATSATYEVKDVTSSETFIIELDQI